MVRWFGIEEASVPTPPEGISRPEMPPELEVALIEVLPQSDRALMEIIVIDCAKR